MQTEHSSIKAVMDLYGFAVDTQNWQLFDQVFTKDVDADWGGTAVWHDIESFKRDFATYHDIFDFTHHVMTNLICDVQGDHAKAVTYGHWLLVRNGTPGGDVWRGQGWYNDELVRTKQGWRISRRRSGLIISEGNAGVMFPGGAPSGGTEFNLEHMSLRQGATSGMTDVLPVLLSNPGVA